MTKVKRRKNNVLTTKLFIVSPLSTGQALFPGWKQEAQPRALRVGAAVPAGSTASCAASALRARCDSDAFAAESVLCPRAERTGHNRDSRRGWCGFKSPEGPSRDPTRPTAPGEARPGRPSHATPIRTAGRSGPVAPPPPPAGPAPGPSPAPLPRPRPPALPAERPRDGPRPPPLRRASAPGPSPPAPGLPAARAARPLAGPTQEGSARPRSAPAPRGGPGTHRSGAGAAQLGPKQRRQMARAPPSPHGRRRDPGSTRGFPELFPGTAASPTQKPALRTGSRRSQ